MEKIMRAADIIRTTLAVEWHDVHVELALIELGRRRRRRRNARIGTGVGGAALALAVAFTGSGGGGSSDGPGRGSLSLTPASPAAPRSAPSAVLGRASTPSPSSSPSHAGAVTAPAVTVQPDAPATVAAPAGHVLAQRTLPRRQVAAARWMALAGQKRFGEAYGLLRELPMRELDDPDQLLLAADVVRLAGHPEKAVPFLQRVVDEHPREFCAQLAAFSLGKIDLDNLDHPSAAAQRFAEVRALAPRGGLAQDALAREVEAWSRAGAREQARERAQEYVRLYPAGRRLAAVKDYGGI